MIHAAKAVEYAGQMIPVDLGILDLVQELWKAGIETTASCQGDAKLYGPVLPCDCGKCGKAGCGNVPVFDRSPEIMQQMCHAAYLGFPSYSEFLLFMNLVAEPPPGYHAPDIEEERDNLTDRQFGHSYSRWEYTVGESFWKNSRFQNLMFVHFPPQDIPLITERLQEAAKQAANKREQLIRALESID